MDNYILKRNNPFITMSIVLNKYPPIILTMHYSNTINKATTISEIFFTLTGFIS